MKVDKLYMSDRKVVALDKDGQAYVLVHDEETKLYRWDIVFDVAISTPPATAEKGK